MAPKRLVIAAVVMAVITVAAYVVSQPRKGTVEYHQKAYFEGHGPIRQWLVAHGPERISEAIVMRGRRRLQHHRQALIRLGYLAEPTFTVSNAPPETVLSRIRPSWCSFGRSLDLLPEEVDVSYYHAVAGTNFVTICCIQKDVDLYKSAISKADVTEAMWEQQVDNAK
jgi:hypothetical protein